MSDLLDSINVLDGVGPKRVQALKKLGIENINDLLMYFPFRYEDLTVNHLSEISDEQKTALKGIVATAPTIARFGPKRIRVNFRLLVDNQSVMVTFFNQPWIKEKVIANEELIVYGKWDAVRKSMTGIKLINQENDVDAIYPANKEISQNTIRQLIKQGLRKYKNAVYDVIPEDLRVKYHLLHRLDMIETLHFPEQQKEKVKHARRTAMFEEFLLFQMGLQILKKRRHVEKGKPIKYKIELVKQFIKQLPFELTDAQKRVTNEILSNLKDKSHMNRLLQGDVGSGKTVVAAIAMFATFTAQKQSVLLAPTEILAEQHANNLVKFFKGFGIQIGLLVGHLKTKERQQLLAGIADGTIDVVVGTHAIIQPNVIFKDLGLGIIDEQHRFGVNQRKALRDKGENTDILAMTATPIPRTLAITTYGDMDVSIINQSPSGRKITKTSWIKKSEWDKVLLFMKHQFDQGKQAFIVTPLIQESEAIDLQNAEELYQQLNEYFGAKFPIAILHGQMDADQKDQIMADFKAGKFYGLVSTTVIEVGVDVPNATLMVIYDADRFGLAQLHQLRGRVGRGLDQAYCILVADPKTEVGKQRMKTMVDTTNGFEIAEADLKMRGQGDLFGKQQSGMPDFKVGDPVVDLGALQTAQIESAKIVNEPDWEKQTENLKLVYYMQHVMKINRHLD